MAGIALPSVDALPEGPRRDLVAALHELYRRAGMPGTRVLSAESRTRDDLVDTISHEGVSAILRGTGIPRWTKVECLVRILSDRAVGMLDAEYEVQRFHALWLAANGIVTPHPATLDEQRNSRVEAGDNRSTEVKRVTAPRMRCLPVYVAVDTSASARPLIDSVNAALAGLLDALMTNPRISEMVVLSVISFDSTARVVLKLTDLQGIDHIPELDAGGATNYSAIFDLLVEEISADVPHLRSDGRVVFRPIVFLITDGEPMDFGWQDAFSRLVDPSWRFHPHVIAFGFGGASRATLGRISTMGAYLAEDATGNEDALISIFNALTSTLTATAISQGLQVPTAPDKLSFISPVMREIEELEAVLRISDLIGAGRRDRLVLSRSSCSWLARTQAPYRSFGQTRPPALRVRNYRSMEGTPKHHLASLVTPA
jgi:uncharacterized protein YegL